MEIQSKTCVQLQKELLKLGQEHNSLKELYVKENSKHKFVYDEMCETNSKLTLAMQSGKMTWWEMDVITGNVTFNKHKVEKLGFSPENFSHYSDFTALIHPEDNKKIMNAMKGHLDGSLDKYEAEYRILASSGEYIWFYDYGSVIKRDLNGAPLICLGFVYNISERKNAEKRLFQISKALDSASDAIGISDSQGHHFYQNKALSDLFGFETAEETEKAGGGMARVKDPVIANQIFKTILQGKSWSGELEMLTKSGRVFPAYERADAIKDKEGNLIGILGIITDMTECRQAEEILLKGENMFQMVLENFPGVVFWKDRQSNYLGCNHSFASGAGLKTPAEIVGKTDHEMPWASTEATKYLNDDRAVMESGKERLHIIESQHQSDGQVLWLNTSKLPLRNSIGQVIGIIGVSNDITTLKMAEQELINTNKELVFQNIEKEKRAEELYIANKELLYQNEEKEKRADELIIANKELVFQNEEKVKRAEELIIANAELAFQNSEKENRAEELIIANKELAFQNEEKAKRATELIAANKELAFQNTEKEKGAAELMNAKDKAEASDRLKTAFINNISHEIRTPLNAILGFAPLIIQPDISKDEKEEFLKILNNSSNRLMNTVNDIMDISLIVSGNMEVHPQPTDISSLLTNVFEYFQEQGKKKNLKVKMEFPDYADNFILQTDGEILRKAISKLVDNSVKFTKEGTITLGFEIKNNNIEIFVKDTGKGIEKNSQELVFESYMQENVSNTRAFEGSGLGLSISKKMIELLGGKMHLESIINEGTTVFLTFPYSK